VQVSCGTRGKAYPYLFHPVLLLHGSQCSYSKVGAFELRQISGARFQVSGKKHKN
jgi:hypothetical protein